MLGEKLQQAIKNADYSMTDVAGQIGITESNLYKLFKKDSFEIAYLVKACEILNLPLSYFINLDNKDNENSQILQKNPTKKRNLDISLLQSKDKDEMYERMLEEKEKRLQEIKQDKEKLEKKLDEKEKRIEELEKLAFDNLRSKQGTNNYRGFIPQATAGGLVYATGKATEVIEIPSAASFE
jgi:transcriptional regulator with XRE-family HTH domain